MPFPSRSAVPRRDIAIRIDHAGDLDRHEASVGRPEDRWLRVRAIADGRLEGLQLLRRAREIDPLNPHVHMHLARTERWGSNLQASNAAYARALELSPGMASLHSSLGLNYLGMGLGEKALAEAGLEPPGGYREYALAIVYHALGRRQESDAALARLIASGEQWAYQIAAVHAKRGEADEVFRWLERAYQEHDSGIVLSRMTNLLEPLHTDARWRPFLERVGLLS